MKVNSEILAKAKEKLEYEYDVELCHRANICYRCGSDLRRSAWNTQNMCPKCCPQYFASTDIGYENL